MYSANIGNIKCRQTRRPTRQTTELAEVEARENDCDSDFVSDEASMTGEVKSEEPEVIATQRKRDSDWIIVAAIDFGTTYSGLGFSFRHEIEKDPSKVHTIVSKTPTAILFTPERNFFKFGRDAEEYYRENADDEDLSQYYYFQNFKLELYGKKNLKNEATMKDFTGKKFMSSIKVFSSAIGYFRGEFKRAMDRQHTFTEKDSMLDKVYWVLTVPAIWDLKAKQFMREAAEKAGIKSSHLALALEPEAASILCNSVYFNLAKEQQLCKFNTLVEGAKYLILDLGGGTVDITAHEILADGALKELHEASGNDMGGNNVNQQYLKFIEWLAGSDDIKSIKENNPSDWLELMSNFESKKCAYKFDDSNKIILKLPEIFQGVLKKPAVLEKLQKSKYHEVSFQKDKIKLTPGLFKCFFEKTVSGILKHVKPILDKHVDIGHILVVGGLAESDIVTNAISEAFPNVKVLVPEDPSFAILKGAVMFGFKPDVIQARVSRYTYGIAKQMPCNRNSCPVERRKLHHGRYYCDDFFDKHVTLGDVIKIGEFQESKEYHPVQNDQVLAHLEFYASTEKNPRLVTDDSCQSLGLMEITLTKREKQEDGTIQVRINVSGTELEIEVREKRTGLITNATCHFLA